MLTWFIGQCMILSIFVSKNLSMGTKIVLEHICKLKCSRHISFINVIQENSTLNIYKLMIQSNRGSKFCQSYYNTMCSQFVNIWQTKENHVWNLQQIWPLLLRKLTKRLITQTIIAVLFDFYFIRVISRCSRSLTSLCTTI